MLTILLVHIVAALTSVGYATYTFVSPTQNKLRMSYGLIATTLASGTYLAIVKSDNLLQTCMTGLVYTAIVSTISLAAQRRLATESMKDMKEKDR